jgi:two-component SAPR family response regulator
MRLLPAKRLLSQRPAIKVLFISGYSEEAIHSEDMAETSTAFLAKPVSVEKMAQTIRDLLKS